MGEENENKILNLLKSLTMEKRDRQNDGENPREHKFWSTQPVVQHEENVENDGEIQLCDTEKLNPNPAPLPAGFEWFIVDIDNADELQATYQLLADNYVEDSEASFRFEYSKEMILWALTPPGWKSEWHVGVRVSATKKMVAFISGVPKHVVVRSEYLLLIRKLTMASINFLCVIRKLRSKRLAPVLIKEITRRFQINGIFQAVYTAGIYLPTPIARPRYYHRPLNPKKLVEVGFSYCPQNQTMSSFIASYRLPTKKSFKWAETKESDCEGVKSLLEKRFKQSNCEFYPEWTVEDTKHYLLPRENAMYSYVVKDDEGHVTDFISFYGINSTINGSATHSTLRCAYLYYYADKDHSSERKEKLILDSLILAKEVYIL